MVMAVYYLTPSTNCSGDPAVLDPYNAKAGTGCSQGSPQNCAVGDLWGKHGKMEGTNYNTKYVRPLCPMIVWADALQLHRPLPLDHQRCACISRRQQRGCSDEQQDESCLHPLLVERLVRICTCCFCCGYPQHTCGKCTHVVSQQQCSGQPSGSYCIDELHPAWSWSGNGFKLEQ